MTSFWPSATADTPERWFRMHKFKLGQSVHFSASKIERGAAGIYRIVAHLPDEHGEFQYRIKSTTSPQERVALESQLRAVESI